MPQTFKYNKGSDSTHGANTQLHYYDRAGINAANLVSVYGQFASRRSMPLRTGKTFKVSRWQHIYDRDLTSAEFQTKGFLSSRDIADVSTGISAAALPEGAGERNLVKFEKVTLETSLSRYGHMIKYTDEVEMFSEEPVVVRYKEELGALANVLVEDLIQRDMLSTNNVMYSGIATSLATMGNSITADGSLDDSYRISYDFIRKCVRKLVRNRAMKHTEVVTGSTKIDTRTVNKAFYAIIGPEVKFDLENQTRGRGVVEEFAYIPAYKYANAANLAEGEVGCLHDVRFIEAESALVYRNVGVEVPASYSGTLSYTGTIGSGAKFDVFPVLFPTKEAFATVGLRGRNKIVFRSQSPEAADLSNPYGTIGYHSYNLWYGAVILQEEKLLKGLVLASA